MAYMRVNYRWKDETSDNVIASENNRDNRENWGKRFFGVIDDNINGRIERAEVDRPTLAGLAAVFPTLDDNDDDALDRDEFAAASGMTGMLLGGGDRSRGAPAARGDAGDD
jgi:hypothetical protein